MKSRLVWALSAVAVLIGMSACTPPPVPDPGGGDGSPTSRVSEAPDGSEANEDSLEPSIDADGASIAYASLASNLVADDFNDNQDIFVYDQSSDVTTRVSVATDGTEANDGSQTPAISPDGNYIAYSSLASNLDPSDTNSDFDIFLHERSTGTTTRISVATDGTEGDSFSQEPDISANGNYIVYRSNASSLVADDTNGAIDTFLYERSTGTTTRVSVASDGTQANATSWDPSISDDGNYIVYESDASNLVADDTNGASDIFLYERSTGTTTRISVATDGTQANSHSETPVISADGEHIAYTSFASNLVTGDTNGTWDIFVYDRSTATTSRVSLPNGGGEADSRSVEPSISGAGTYVAFRSNASNLVTGDTNGTWDIFVYDRTSAITSRVSIGDNGAQANADSEEPAISDDGRYVAFRSLASNLVPGGTNHSGDVFVYDRIGGSPPPPGP